MAITQYYFRQAKSIGWLRPRARTAVDFCVYRCYNKRLDKLELDEVIEGLSIRYVQHEV